MLPELHEIPTGCCILWSGKCVLSRLIRFFSGSRFSHASLTVNVDGLQCGIVEAEATGLELRELRELMLGYKGEIWLFIPDNLVGHTKGIYQLAIEECASAIPYDFGGLFMNIIRRTNEKIHKFFCSAFCWEVWRENKMCEGDISPRPGDIPTWMKGSMRRLA